MITSTKAGAGRSVGVRGVVARRHDQINPDQPPFWRFAGNERFRFHADNLREVFDLE